MTEKVKTPRVDSIETLFSKILATLAEIDETQKVMKDRIYAWAIEAKDADDRDRMVRTLGTARRIVREQAEMAEERERFNTATEPVRKAWEAANSAWTKWVEAEVAKNSARKAQLVMSRAFWMRFAEADARIAQLWNDGPDAIPGLVADLEVLANEVANYYQGNWCEKCGEPIPDMITPKNGGQAFKPRLCGDCRNAEKAQRADSQEDVMERPVQVAPGARKKAARHAEARKQRQTGFRSGENRKKGK